jgi:uncharacterized protein (TIGR03437 family)
MTITRTGLARGAFRHAVSITLSLLAIIPVPRAAAQSAAGTPLLTYVPGSTTKLEQVIGDCDWQVLAQKGACLPTASQTVTRFNVLGNGQGGSFEHNGKMIFLFGDTISKDVSVVNYHAADPVAWSTSTDPEAGLLLNFYTNGDGSPLFVKPPGIPMGPDAIPNAGISLNGQIYLVCNIGSDTSLANPQSVDTSVLVQFNETAQTFTGGRSISPVGGHFINASMHASGANVLLFGAGPYRASDVYLQMTPAGSFASGAGTQYFAGLVNGQPAWTGSETGAVPVVQDNPLNGPAWPNDSPSVGNLSVVYSSALSLWLMTYDGGRQSNKTRGVYFTYAPQPWGPWATPQLIFNDVRDNASGVYIHNPSIVPDPPGDGLNGPVIGSNNPYTTFGGGFAPLMIERFLTVTGNTLKIYYTLSTWNPYTVVKMRSQFTIASTPAINLVANAEGESPTIAPNTWAEIKGLNLAPANDSRIWRSSDFVGGKLPSQLDGVSVTVNGKAAYVYYISPSQVNILTPPDAMSGPVQVQVANGGTVSAAFTAQARAESPSFFVFNGGPYVAATHADGSLLGPVSLYPGSTTPARPGETVVLYANGFGPTSTPIVSGSLSQSGALSPLPVIEIGGAAATVQFAGLVSPGEFQFNVVVPPNTPDGDQSVTGSYNGLTTQVGTSIAVQH